MLENVKAPGQGAVAPQVLAPPLAQLVALDVLDHDGLGAKAGVIHFLKAQEPQRDQLSLGVLVADDQTGKASLLQQRVRVAGGGIESLEVALRVRRIGEVIRQIAEADDVVIRGVEHEQLGVRPAPRPQDLAHALGGLGPRAISLEHADLGAQRAGRELVADVPYQLGLELHADAAPPQTQGLDGRGPRTKKEVDDGIALARVAGVNLGGDLGDEIAVIVELVPAAPVPAVEEPQRVGEHVFVLPPTIQVDIAERGFLGQESYLPTPRSRRRTPRGRGAASPREWLE